MSPRDTYWFIAGAASGLMVGALAAYLLVGSPATAVVAASDSARAQTNTPDPLMPGDRWPTLADADSTGSLASDSKITSGATATPSRTGAGSLDAVTRSLAQRLATKGGTDDEWRLLAQSYEYMGRADDARAARKHVTRTSTNSASEAAGGNVQEGTKVFGTVQIDDKLASLATPGTTLFIYATDTASPGPPLAVLRLRVEHWPVTFVLDDADAMIPGRNLSSVKSVQLEARISPSGEALPSPGDLVGSLAAVDPHSQHAVNISIDRKIT
ncbi:MAG TPA: hypothetical protein VI653_18295 [Steroidobacteraceae bacterium]